MLIARNLAGVGYFFAGVPMPVFLGFLTMVTSFVAFGAPLMYVPVCLYMILFSGRAWAGVALLVWSVLVVSSIDNVLRTVLISRVTRHSMLLVLIGVLGGLINFGFLGIFVGPVVVAIAKAIWDESVMVAKERAMQGEAEGRL